MLTIAKKCRDFKSVFNLGFRMGKDAAWIVTEILYFTGVARKVYVSLAAEISPMLNIAIIRMLDNKMPIIAM